jgi:hypothetical protein
MNDESLKLDIIHLEYGNRMRKLMTQLILMCSYKVVPDSDSEWSKICEGCKCLITQEDKFYSITLREYDDYDEDDVDEYFDNRIIICSDCKNNIIYGLLPYKNREITRRLLVDELPIIADICALINAWIFALLQEV